MTVFKNTQTGARHDCQPMKYIGEESTFPTNPTKDRSGNLNIKYSGQPSDAPTNVKTCMEHVPKSYIQK